MFNLQLAKLMSGRLLDMNVHRGEGGGMLDHLSES